MALEHLGRRAAGSTVASLFLARARERPGALALTDSRGTRTRAELLERVRRLVRVLVAFGVGRGDRVAVLSENRTEYVEVYLAAAWIGAIVACQNTRLAPPELAHCVSLVSPRLRFASERHAERLPGDGPVLVFGESYERILADVRANELPGAPDPEVGPEDALLVLYTSGTTGLPKGAVISHRAEIVRNLVVRAEYGLRPDSTYVAWSPMYHMGGAEYTIGSLISGGAVHVVDGFDPERLVDIACDEELGWLLLMPGMVGRFADAIEASGRSIRGVQVCGVMADLVPPADLARITRLLQAPYANTFGATETGNPPCSAGMVPIGVAPERLSKVPSAYCEIRVVDAEGQDVPNGTPGELWMRGPTLFSGYWAQPEADAECFSGGWFHMGDVFVRNPDGSLDFVDRVKYLVKTGGENVYPAEIERVLLQDPRVAEAAVVRRKDERWGEVPVAFVAARDPSLTAEELLARCRAALAGYKQPKAIRFLDYDAFPRSASGKVQRHLLEDLL